MSTVVSPSGNIYPREGGTVTRDVFTYSAHDGPGEAQAAAGLSDASSAIITQALKELKARQEDYQTYCDYYDGRHRLTFATEKFRNAFGFLFRTLADNLCPAVVDAVVDKLEVTGFGTEDDGGADGGAADLGDTAWDIWQANRMDERAGEVHQEAAKTGNAYVIVWPGRDGQPVIYPNTSDIVTLSYDLEVPGRVEWAAKIWALADKRLRCTIYFPDRIEKYITTQSYDGSRPDDGKMFGPHFAADANGALEAWPLPNPWGRVPVFHFASNAGVGKQGRSDLQNALPMQNALNKTVCDMLVGMEFAALPQRWATGLEVPVDEDTGRPKELFKAAVDRLWTVADEDVKFGEFGTANLEMFLKVADNFRLSMARNTATPLTYMMLMTDPPSGEALKTLESRSTKKCHDRQTTFGNVWEDLMALAVMMSTETQTQPGQLSTQWRDPAPKSEAEEVNTQLVKQQLGVSKRQSLKELGYADQQIKDMLAENAEAAATAGALALKMFDNGTVDGTA